MRPVRDRVRVEVAPPVRVRLRFGTWIGLGQIWRPKGKEAAVELPYRDRRPQPRFEDAIQFSVRVRIMVLGSTLWGNVGVKAGVNVGIKVEVEVEVAFEVEVEVGVEFGATVRAKDEMVRVGVAVKFEAALIIGANMDATSSLSFPSTRGRSPMRWRHADATVTRDRPAGVSSRYWISTA